METLFTIFFQSHKKTHRKVKHIIIKQITCDKDLKKKRLKLNKSELVSLISHSFIVRHRNNKD